MIIYTVKSNDTLYSVANKFGISPSLLAVLSGVLENESLVVGQNLLILIPKTIYKVQNGDTLFKIGEKFGISQKQLLRNNPSYILNPTLNIGDEIIIEYEPEKKLKIETNGYAYPYINENILKSALPYMTYLSPFTYGFKPNGEIINLDDASLLAAATEYSTIPLMHLSTLTDNGTFSNELATKIFNSEEAKQYLITSVENIISQKGYGGLDIDFEFINTDEAPLYAELIESFSKQLNPQNIPVYAALAPKTSSEQKGTLYEGHNYKLIGGAANGVLLMTYEWGYTYGPPMAVAPIASVRNVLEYALSQINADKIFLGIPNYGYDWTLPFIKGSSKARSVSTAEAVALARKYKREILFDEYSGSPHFNYYEENGTEHEVWFEDMKSMNLKYALIKEYNLRGAGFWNLMRPFNSARSLLNALFDIT